MKRQIAVALLTFGIVHPALATKVTWTGSICITAFTAACPAGDWAVECYNMKYRPPNLGDNGPETHFAFGNDNFRYGLDLDTGSLIGKTFKPVRQTTVTTFGFTPTITQLRFTKHKPDVLTETTTSVEIEGNIKNVDGYANCNLTFRAGGILVP